MPDSPTETTRLLEAELAHIRALSASLKRLGIDVSAEVGPTVKALKARIAGIERELEVS